MADFSRDPIQEIKEKLDIVKVIGNYIKLKKAGANYRALCPFHSEKKPSFFVSPARQMWHCFGCFVPGSLIKTRNGFHKIEDLQPGQEVLTHQGRYRPITRSLIRPYQGEIIDLKVKKSSKVTSLTEDHEVYAIKTKNCKNRANNICTWNCDKNCSTKFWQDYHIEKMPANKLSRHDLLLYPVNEQVQDMEYVDLEDYYDREESNYGPTIKKIPTKIKVDEKLLKLLGYYIAEGSNHRAYIRFSLNQKEKGLAKDIQKLIKDLFSLNSSLHKRIEDRNGLEVTVCNSKLSNIFENLCGSGASNKHIPFEFENLPLAKQKILLEAYHRGDGTVSKVPKCKTERNYRSVSTTSLILAKQVRDILLRRKIGPGLYIEKEKVDKKGVHHREAYRLKWQEDYKLHYSHFYRDPETKNLYWSFPIEEIKRRKYKGNTYDLTVAEDHSYLAENFVVGNCGAGYDMFDFVMKIEGVEFGDALRILAKKAGVQLKPQNPELKTKRQRLYNICELGCQFFEKQLKESKAGKRVREYLLGRGITKESIKKWRLGYAPDTWRGLSDFLVSEGFKREEIVKAGLAVDSEKAKTPYDRFRGRIMFPVFDFNNQIIGFGGRITKKEEKTKSEKSIAKYINIPQTLLYDKSRILYGLNKARVPIRKKNKCILAEGYTDVILSHQNGFENTVASSGTALTPFHLKTLKRYSDNLLLAFDMDVAGDTATKRGIDLAQRRGFEIKVIKMPQGSDPADIISDDPQKWQKAIEKAQSILEFYFNFSFSKFDRKDPAQKKEIAKVILPVIKRIPNKIEQSHWVQEIAKRLEVREEDIFEELKKTKPSVSYSGTKEVPSSSQDNFSEREDLSRNKKSRKQILQEKIISLLLAYPKYFNLIEEELISFFSGKSQQILSKLQKNDKKDFDKALTNLQKKSDEDIKQFLSGLLLHSEVEEEEEPEKEISLCLSELKRIQIKNKLEQVSTDIKKAEQKADDSQINSLVKKFNKLSQQLREI